MLRFFPPEFPWPYSLLWVECPPACPLVSSYSYPEPAQISTFQGGLPDSYKEHLLLLSLCSCTQDAENNTEWVLIIICPKHAFQGQRPWDGAPSLPP